MSQKKCASNFETRTVTITFLIYVRLDVISWTFYHFSLLVFPFIIIIIIKTNVISKVLFDNLLHIRLKYLIIPTKKKKRIKSNFSYY